MKIKLFLVAIIATSIITPLFTSCTDDGDTTPPHINLINPMEGDTLKIGSEYGIHLEMELSDDVMLASYKIQIHNNFNDHGHERLNSEPTVAFAFDKWWNISGLKNTQIHHHEIKIPANATAGKYHFMVYCTDAAGNESHVARNIVLSNEGEDGSHN